MYVHQEDWLVVIIVIIFFCGVFIWLGYQGSTVIGLLLHVLLLLSCHFHILSLFCISSGTITC